MSYADTTQNKRKVERISLPLPVKVEIKETQDIVWSEITRFTSVSNCGAGFEIKRAISVGQLLQLTSPFPQKLRSYDYLENQYKVWTVVRYCLPSLQNSDSFRVGVAFIGKMPPNSYHQDPTKIYGLANSNQLGLFDLNDNFDPTNLSQEPQIFERKNQRHPIPMEFFLEALDKDNKPISFETTVSENISICGAAVFTTLEVEVGQKVRVNSLPFNISLMAEVRNRRVGSDGMPRLHLKFIDKQFPLERIN